MPRDGSGHSHNAIEADENLIHGEPAGSERPTDSGVDRSNKAAPPPEKEAGEAITESASGGGSQSLTGVGSGKGAKSE